MEILAPVINSSSGDMWARIATLAGNGGLEALLTALFLLAGWYFHQKKIAICVFSCLAGLAVSGILVQLFKFAVGRGRPGMELPA